MPVQQADRVIAGFRPDTATENEDGLAIKREALYHLDGKVQESTPPPREVFQSYGSLPEALKPLFHSTAKRPSAG